MDTYERPYLGRANPPSSKSGVERGERNVTFAILCMICGGLGCDIAALTAGIPAPAPPRLAAD